MREYPEPILEIENARQRIVKRNWKFFFIPMLILILLLSDLTWEIVRSNMTTTICPWKFTLLGVTSSATLSGVFASLLIARGQFAMSMRPNISWSTHFSQSTTMEGKGWITNLSNFGPGIATIENVSYSIKICKDTVTKQESNLSWLQIITILNEFGLKEGIDFQLMLLTKGAPLPQVKQKSEGIEFAVFKEILFNFVRRIEFNVLMVVNHYCTLTWTISLKK